MQYLEDKTPFAYRVSTIEAPAEYFNCMMTRFRVPLPDSLQWCNVDSSTLNAQVSSAGTSPAHSPIDSALGFRMSSALVHQGRRDSQLYYVPLPLCLKLAARFVVGIILRGHTLCCKSRSHLPHRPMTTVFSANTQRETHEYKTTNWRGSLIWNGCVELLNGSLGFTMEPLG